MSGSDPFDTAGIRDRVLATWSATPDRFREDANAEEDLVLGGYRDRLIVELAQNAADAALAAGTPGRVQLTLRSEARELIAANTGRPLDAAGVRALATLRASAKRADDSAVGRFGVGFAAVLAVCDEPEVRSRDTGVRFSRAETTRQVGSLAVADLTAEVEQRAGRVPVLRLPFPLTREPPPGWDTAVVLALRDEGSVELVRRLLDEVDDALLLALPALASIEVRIDERHRVLTDAGPRWHTRRRSGSLDESERAALLADRPVEEAARPGWSVLWALPRTAETALPGVLYAPTPTDEPMDWPGLLLASFPLEPSRRHVAPGPMTDWLAARAGEAYADLLGERAAAGEDVVPLVPSGLPSGPVDAAVRARVLELLPDTAMLRAVSGERLLRPAEAVMLDGAAGSEPGPLSVLAPYVAGLVAASVSARPVLRRLGVDLMSLADVLDALPAAPDPPGWRARYDGLAALAQDPADREALGALAVPLADGRLARGPRGLLLPGPELADLVPEPALAALVRAGVRLVHPGAAHPLLARLGARPATARELLADPAVRDLVEGSPEADDPDEVAEVVLALVAAAVAAGELAPGDLPWLGDLALEDTDGELAPAGALALPGSPAADLFDPEEIGLVSESTARRWGDAVLTAASVLDGFGVVRAVDPLLADPPEELADLDGYGEWVRQLGGADQVVGEFLAVRDLDAVRPDAWPDALRLLAGRPDTRAALLEPLRLRGPSGEFGSAAPFTAWWLGRRLDLSGCRDPDAGAGPVDLLDDLPGWAQGLDPSIRRALGAVCTLDDLTADAVPALLRRLADTDRRPPLAGLLPAWAWLARQAAEAIDAGREPVGEPPSYLAAVTSSGREVDVVPADRAVVVDAPQWLQRGDVGAFVVAPPGLGEALADLLDLPVGDEVGGVEVTGAAASEPVPEQVRALLPGAAPTWCRHERLLVGGAEVRWWVSGDGTVHAVDQPALALALAWAAGSWSRRDVVAAVLAGGEAARAAQLEAAFD